MFFFSAAAALRETGRPLLVPTLGARVRDSIGDAGAGGSLDTFTPLQRPLLTTALGRHSKRFNIDDATKTAGSNAQGEDGNTG